MFPAVLVKNDAFGAESVNHNSAMHIAGWETHADVHHHHQAAQSQSLASENVPGASPGALSLCAVCTLQVVQLRLNGERCALHGVAV